MYKVYSFAVYFGIHSLLGISLFHPLIDLLQAVPFIANLNRPQCRKMCHLDLPPPPTCERSVSAAVAK